MELYIRIENGQPFRHPALKSNLIQALGKIPDNWEPFERVEPPILGVYEVLGSDQPTYEKVNDVWTDVWSVRPMTDIEKTAKQQEVINAFRSREQAENWSAWILDEATCTMVPPIPRPEPDQAKLDQKIMTYWCGADGNWKDTPPRPEGDYKFDFFAWEWIEISS